jgi:hypothetical protein
LVERSLSMASAMDSSLAGRSCERSWVRFPAPPKIPSNRTWSSCEVDFFARICVSHIHYMASTVPRLFLYPSPAVCFNATENHHCPCSASSSAPARHSSHVAGRKGMSAHETHYSKTSSRATIALFIQRSHGCPLSVSCRKAQPLSHGYHISCTIPPYQTKIR